jgi:two-component sensor histidine kinase/PAS domain-containing protein
MNNVVHECETLTQEDIAILSKIEQGLSVLADFSRADVLLYCPLTGQRAVVASQASPHSILPIYGESVVERQVTFSEEPAVFHALIQGHRGVTEIRREFGSRRSATQRAPIVQETYPIRASDGRVIAAVSIETNLIERERHHRRSKVFQRALKQFQEMVLAGKFCGVDKLTPFGEHDGIIVLDAQHRIQYISGIATSLYRKLGYPGNLLKQHIEDLEMDEHSLVIQAMEEGCSLEREQKIGSFVWVKKAIPLYTYPRGVHRLLTRSHAPCRLEGALVAIRDETDSRRQEEELLVKSTMIKEIHHRVKNNMQTIASLLRLQSRRAESEPVRRALQDSINRILSVAVIHEFLAHQEARVINIRDVSQRIINQFREGVLDREANIRLDLRGPNIYLPTQSATVCALVVNELLQNALEHGYERQAGGTVTVNLQDDGQQITISVDDDGEGLPEEFDLSQTSSLGLQIVQTLAQGDLKGRFELRRRDKGVSAVVTFPKHTQGGR